MRVVRGEPPYLTLGSAFAGIGGFDLAADSVGVPAIAWSEFNPASRSQPKQQVLSARFPDSVGHGDVKELSYRDFGRPSLITGGSPCQGLSTAGGRRGFEDDRSILFFELVRLQREGIADGGLRYLVWENVPGALSSNKGRDFSTAVAEFLGAEEVSFPRVAGRTSRWAGAARGPTGWFAWRTLDAQYFGVAQRRRRVFGVWSRDDAALAALFGRQVFSRTRERPDLDAGGMQVWFFDTGETGFNVGEAPDCPETVELSRVLEDRVDPNYYLSPRACRGVLRRAGNGGKSLPAVLDHALRSQAGEDGKEPPWDDDGRFVAGEPVAVPGVANTLTAHHGRNSGEDTYIPVSVVGDVAHTMTGNGHGASEDGTGRGTPIVPQSFNWQSGGDARGLELTSQTSALTTSQTPAVLMAMREGKDGGGKGPLLSEDESLTLATGNSQELFAPVPIQDARENKGQNGSGVGKPGDPAYTLDTLGQQACLTPIGYKGSHADATEARPRAFLPQYGVRRLTPVEAERLQGLPDDWTLVEGGRDTHRYRALGDAVAVPVAAWVIARIKAAHEQTELPELPQVLEKLPWLRRGSSDESPKMSRERRKKFLRRKGPQLSER